MTWRDAGRKIGVFVKTYYKPFLFLFGLYAIALITLLRDHYTFTDDLYRAIYGDAWVTDFNRYASSALAFFLHQNLRLFDISPIPQLIAMMFMAATSLMLVKLFVGDPKSIKKSFWPLIMSAFITLCPFMINAWMYEFDAPCMAMAIFVSVLPYALFWEKMTIEKMSINTAKDTLKITLELLIIMLCILAMWMSFQAACGVFLAIGLALIMRDILRKKKIHIFRILLFLGLYLAISVLTYFMTKNGSYYRSIATFSFGQMLAGILNNLAIILRCSLDSLKVWWMILLGVIAISCLVLISGRTKNWHIGALMFIFMVLATIVGIGPYLTLQEFPINGRSMMGICLAFTLFLLLCWSEIGKKKTKWLWLVYVPTILLLYGFMTFSWSFGNALASQYEHDTQRVIMITKDIAEEFPDASDYSYKAFRIVGSAGFSAVMVHHFDVFPAAKYVYFIAQEGVNSDTLGYYRLFDYSDLITPWTDDWFDEEYDCSKGEYEDLRNNYYYKIRQSIKKIKGRNLVCIDLKEDARPYYYNSIEPFFSPLSY